MLLNEFLKEHRKGQEQDAAIAQLKAAVALQQKEIQDLTTSLKEQPAQLRKVSDQLATNSPLQQLLVENR